MCKMLVFFIKVMYFLPRKVNFNFNFEEVQLNLLLVYIDTGFEFRVEVIQVPVHHERFVCSYMMSAHDFLSILIFFEKKS